MKKAALFLLKFATTVGIVWFLFQKVDFASAWEAVRSVSLKYFLLGFTISAFSWYLNSVRWSKLLEIAGIQVSAFKLFLYNLIGNFYSIILPGGKLTGDAVCAYRFTKDFSEPESRGKYFISVFIDRFLGVYTIVFLLSLFFIFQHPIIYIFGESTALLLGAIMVSITVGGLIAIFFPIFDSLLDWFSRLPIGPFAKLFSHLVSALRAYRQDKNKLGVALLYSAVGMFFTPLAVYAMGLALGLEVGFWEILFIYLLATVLIILPITIGGIGLREGGIIYFLTLAGAEPSKAAALSIIMFAIFVLLSLVGGLLELQYHFFKKNE